MPGKNEAKVEPGKVAMPVKKMTAFEHERIAARQKMHEEEVRRYLIGR